MRKWFALVVALVSFTACGAEPTGACPTIRERGVSVASGPTLYAACDPARADACGPGLECWNRVATSVTGLCSARCSADRDCTQPSDPRYRAVCLIERPGDSYCLLVCRDDSDCRSGTVCVPYARAEPMGFAGACTPMACVP